MTRYRVLDRPEPPAGPRIAYRDTWRPRWVPRPVWARWTRLAARLAGWTAFLLLAAAVPVAAGDRVSGTASWYGPGTGVATQWCTWTLRHTAGCGLLAIQSHDTGATVVAPVIDWCQCYRDTADERIVDLQWDVVAALGLDLGDGLYRVTTWRVDDASTPPSMADTAVAR